MPITVEECSWDRRVRHYVNDPCPEIAGQTSCVRVRDENDGSVPGNGTCEGIPSHPEPHDDAPESLDSPVSTDVMRERGGRDLSSSDGAHNKRNTETPEG